MKVNALLMDEKDNVVTCVEEIPAGGTVVYQDGDRECTVKAEETIPYCHKIALQDLAAGEEVLKYGESLGKLIAPVAKGHCECQPKSEPLAHEFLSHSCS